MPVVPPGAVSPLGSSTGIGALTGPQPTRARAAAGARTERMNDMVDPPRSSRGTAAAARVSSEGPANSCGRLTASAGAGYLAGMRTTLFLGFALLLAGCPETPPPLKTVGEACTADGD